MKIIKDCWDYLGVSDCQYGAYVFNGDEFSIYVSNWLFVSEDLMPIFSRQNEAGCVGHCILKFVDVSWVRLQTSIYRRSGGDVVWTDPIVSAFQGNGSGEVEYDFSGSLKGFQSSIELQVKAGSFELHVLQRDEPAKE